MFFTLCQRRDSTISITSPLIARCRCADGAMREGQPREAAAREGSPRAARSPSRTDFFHPSSALFPSTTHCWERVEETASSITVLSAVKVEDRAERTKAEEPPFCREIQMTSQ